MHQQRPVEGARDQSWPGTLMVAGIFVVVITFWWAGTRTLTSYMELGRWFALFAFVGNLLPYKRAGLTLGMERLEWFLFNLLAVGPLLFSAALWLNLLVHGPEKAGVVNFSGDIRGLRTYWTQTDHLPVFVEEADPDGDAPSIGHGQHLLGTATGLFGYPVVVTWAKADGWSD